MTNTDALKLAEIKKRHKKDARFENIMSDGRPVLDAAHNDRATLLAMVQELTTERDNAIAARNFMEMSRIEVVNAEKDAAIDTLTTDRDRFKAEAEAAKAEAAVLLEFGTALSAATSHERAQIYSSEKGSSHIVGAVYKRDEAEAAFNSAVTNRAPLATAHLAEVAGLRAALKPFADLGGELGDGVMQSIIWKDDAPIEGAKAFRDGKDYFITLRDLRAAHKAFIRTTSAAEGT